MKLIIKFFCFFIFFEFLCCELCTQEEKCLLFKKYLTYIPVYDELGIPQPKSQQKFDYKIIKIFKNSIAIYSSVINSPEIEKSLNLNDADLKRRISFGKIYLDCGADGNKLCLANQFIEIYDKVTYSQEAIDYMKKKNGEFNRQCIIIPIIDHLSSDLSSNLIYICEEDRNKIREFLKFRDYLSRYIDMYNIAKISDYYNAQNSLAYKLGSLQTTDNQKSFSKIFAILTSYKINIYLEKNNFNTKLYDINLLDINLTIGVKPVVNAIRDETISLAWSTAFKPKPIDSCCFLIPLKGINNFRYFCINFDNSEDYSSYECERKVSIWVSKIMNLAKKNFLIDSFVKIEEQNYKKNKEINLDCRTSEFLRAFTDRIQNIGLFQDASCDFLQGFSQNFEMNNCISDKTNDINDEIWHLAFKDNRLRTPIEACLQKGFLNIGKIQIDNLGKSFLEIKMDVNDIKKKKNNNFLG